MTDKPTHSTSMVPRAPIISESEVSITAPYLLCSPSYTAVWIKNWSKSTSVIKVATVKNAIVPRALDIVWNQSIHCPSASAMFNSLHSSKNCLKFTSVIKVATMKSMDNFCYAKEAIMCNHQINAFHCQQRWMDHKGGHW